MVLFVQKTLLRFLFVLCSFLLLFSSSCAESSIDWSVYSDDELVSLYDSLVSCFDDRGLVFRRKLEEGTYTVGSDFPQGLYYVTPLYSARFSLYSSDGGVNNARTYNLFPFSDSFLFEFYNGCELVLESGTITISTAIDGYTRSYLNMSPLVVSAFNSTDYSFDASVYREPDYASFLSAPQLFYDYHTYFGGCISHVTMDVAGMAMFTLITPSSDRVWVYGFPQTRPDDTLQVGDMVIVYGTLAGTHEDVVGNDTAQIPSLMAEHIVLQ